MKYNNNDQFSKEEDSQALVCRLCLQRVNTPLLSEIKNVKEMNYNGSRCGMGDLHIAAAACDIVGATTILMCSNNDFVNKKNCSGETALHIATRVESGEMVTLLLKSGALVTCVDADGVRCDY